MNILILLLSISLYASVSSSKNRIIDINRFPQMIKTPPEDKTDQDLMEKINNFQSLIKNNKTVQHPKAVHKEEPKKVVKHLVKEEVKEDLRPNLNFENDKTKWTPSKLYDFFHDLGSTKYAAFNLIDEEKENVTDTFNSYLESDNNNGNKIFFFAVDEVEDEENIGKFMEEFVAKLSFPTDFPKDLTLFALYSKKLNTFSYVIGSGLTTLTEKVFSTISTSVSYYFEKDQDKNGIHYIIQNIVYKIDYTELTPETYADAFKMDYDYDKQFMITDLSAIFTAKQQDSLKTQLLGYLNSNQELRVFLFVAKSIEKGKKFLDVYEQFKGDFTDKLSEEDLKKAIFIFDIASLSTGGVRIFYGTGIPDDITSKFDGICTNANEYKRNEFFTARFVIRELCTLYIQPDVLQLDEFIDEFYKYDKYNYQILDYTMVLEEETIDKFNELMKNVGDDGYKVFFLVLKNPDRENFLEEFVEKYFETKTDTTIDRKKTVFVKFVEDGHNIQTEIIVGKDINMYLDAIRIYDLYEYITDTKIATAERHTYDEVMDVLIDSVYILTKVIYHGWKESDLANLMKNLYKMPYSKAFYKGGDLTYEETFRLRALNEIIGYSGSYGSEKALFVFSLNKFENEETEDNFLQEIVNNFNTYYSNIAIGASTIILINLDDYKTGSIGISIYCGDELGIGNNYIEEIIRQARTYLNLYDVYKYLANEIRAKTVSYWNDKNLWNYYINTEPHPLVTPSVSGHLLDPNAYAYQYPYVSDYLEKYFKEMKVQGGVFYNIFILDKLDNTTTIKEITNNMLSILSDESTENKEMQFLLIYEVETNKMGLYIGENLTITETEAKELFNTAVNTYFSQDLYFEGYTYMVKNCKYKLIYPKAEILAIDLYDETKGENQFLYDQYSLLTDKINTRVITEFFKENNVNIFIVAMKDIELDTAASEEEYFNLFVDAFWEYKNSTEEIEDLQKLISNSIVYLFIKERNKLIGSIGSELNETYQLISIKESVETKATELLESDFYLGVKYILRQYAIQIFNTQSHSIEDYADSLPVTIKYGISDLTYLIYDSEYKSIYTSLSTFINLGYSVFFVATSVTDGSTDFLEKIKAKYFEGSVSADQEKSIFVLFVESTSTFEIISCDELKILLTDKVISDITAYAKKQITSGTDLSEVYEYVFESIGYCIYIINGIWSENSIFKYIHYFVEERNYMLLDYDDFTEAERKHILASYDVLFKSEGKYSIYTFFLTELMEGSTLETFTSFLQANFPYPEGVTKDNAIFTVVIKNRDEFYCMKGDNVDLNETQINDIYIDLEEYLKEDKQYFDGLDLANEKLRKYLTGYWTPQTLSDYVKTDDLPDYLFSDPMKIVSDVDNMTEYLEFYFENLKSKGLHAYIFLVDHIQDEDNVAEFMNEFYKYYVGDEEKNDTFFGLYSLNVYGLHTSVKVGANFQDKLDAQAFRKVIRQYFYVYMYLGYYKEAFKKIMIGIQSIIIPLGPTQLAEGLVSELGNESYIFYDPEQTTSTREKEILTTQYMEEIVNNGQLKVNLYSAVMNEFQLEENKTEAEYFQNFVENITNSTTSQDYIITLMVRGNRSLDMCFYSISESVENKFGLEVKMPSICEDSEYVIGYHGEYAGYRSLFRGIRKEVLYSNPTTSSDLVAVFRKQSYTNSPLIDQTYYFDLDTKEQIQTDYLLKMKDLGVNVFVIYVSNTEEENLLQNVYDQLKEDQGETTLDLNKNIFILYLESNQTFQIVRGDSVKEYLPDAKLQEIITYYNEQAQVWYQSFDYLLPNLLEEMNTYIKRTISLWTAEALNEYLEWKYPEKNYFVHSSSLSTEDKQYVEDKLKTIYEDESKKNLSIFIIEVDKIEDETLPLTKFVSDLYNNFYLISSTRKYITNSTFIFTDKERKKVAFAIGSDFDPKLVKGAKVLAEKLEEYFFGDDVSYIDGYKHFLNAFDSLNNDVWTPEEFGYYLYKSLAIDGNALYTEVSGFYLTQEIVDELNVRLNKLGTSNTGLLTLIIGEIPESVDKDNFLSKAIESYTKYEGTTNEDEGYFTNTLTLLIISVQTGDDVALNAGSGLSGKITESDLQEMYDNSISILNSSYSVLEDILLYSTGMLSYYTIFERSDTLTPEQLIDYYEGFDLDYANVMIFDPYHLLDISSRRMTVFFLNQPYDQDIQSYAFVLPKLASNKTGDDYINAFAQKYFSWDMHKKVVVVFGTQSELEFKIGRSDSVIRHFSDHSVDYILSLAKKYDQEVNTRLMVISYYIYTIGTFEQNMIPEDLASYFNSWYYKEKYGLIDLFLYMDYEKGEELETTYFKNFSETGNVYPYMFIIKNMDDSYKNGTTFLLNLVNTMIVPQIDTGKDTRIYILYSAYNKKLDYYAFGKRKEKLTEKMDNISESVVVKITSEKYEGGVEYLLEEMRTFIYTGDDIKGDGSKSLPVYAIVLISIGSIIVVFIIIFFVYRLVGRKFKTERLMKKKLLVASIAAEALGKEEEMGTPLVD